jgi:small subunit ribosomal protein S16
MALRIRLSRGGAKKHPFYRIVVAENTAPRDGSFVERLGSYDPFLNNEDPNRFVVAQDRVRYWLSVGAQATNRVAKILSDLQIIEATPLVAGPKKSAPKKKAQTRLSK